MERIDKIFSILKSKVKDVPPMSKMPKSFRNSSFKILISIMMSSRTKDEVTVKASKNLFLKAKTAKDILKLKQSEIEKLIYPIGFYKTKAKNIIKISKKIISDFKGKVPQEKKDLESLPGVGLKTANLVLIKAFNQDEICVDTHVHRISNRLKLTKTKTPEETYFKLKETLNKKYWKSINELFVVFGQKTCKPIGPKCDICPIEKLCTSSDKRNSDKRKNSKKKGTD
jgi:endonuclease III